MPVPEIKINYPPGGKVRPTPHKLLYMRQQRRELARIAKEKLKPWMVAALVKRDSQRYFYIDWRTFVRQKHLNGEANTLVRDFAATFTDLDRPRSDYIQKFDDYEVMDAFNIAKLNECFASPKLKGTNSAAILKSMGLRGGLPDNSVVPSIRMFDRQMFINVIVNPHSHVLTEESFCANLEVPRQARVPLARSVFHGAPNTREEFTITTATAQGILASVNTIVPGLLPSVDEVFPQVNPRNLSWKLEPRLHPLDPRDGNVI